MASLKVQETPLFLETERAARLFCLIYEPSHPPRAAILYCNPLFEEHIHSYRTAVNFARHASSLGYAVMRFDYFGEGESDGLFEETTVSSRVADILTAASYLRQRLQAEVIYLVGLRFGATLALLASETDHRIAGVICWAPLLKLVDYLHDLLRLNIASQLVQWKGVKFSKDALAERMYRGETISLEGYEVGRKMYEEATALDLTKKALKSACKVLVLQPVTGAVSDTETAEFIAVNSAMDITLKCLIKNLFWLKLPIPDPACEYLYEASMQWLVNPEAHLGNTGQVHE